MFFKFFSYPVRPLSTINYWLFIILAEIINTRRELFFLFLKSFNLIWLGKKCNHFDVLPFRQNQFEIIKLKNQRPFSISPYHSHIFTFPTCFFFLGYFAMLIKWSLYKSQLLNFASFLIWRFGNEIEAKKMIYVERLFCVADE